MIYIERKLEKTILKYLDKREIIAVVGPRQSGKTTMLQKIQSNLEKSIFLSFEDRQELELFEMDIKGFAKKYSDYKYIFIDEFQYSKSGGKNLKFLYDTYPSFKIIVSGSSTIDLTIHAIKFLVGRVFTFNLYQLDFEEFLSFKEPDIFKLYTEARQKISIINNRFGQLSLSETVNTQIQSALEAFIIFGGYPRVAIADSDDEKKIILKNIYNTYFLRDIRDTLGLIDDYKLSKLIKALALQVGQLIEYNELANISGYDHLTLKKYLNILEKTFICQTVRPFFANKRVEIVKNPKIFFFDTGLHNLIIDDFKKFDDRTDKGFLLENFVFNQLNKAEAQINFWRTKSQAEVDFVITHGSDKMPIEIKSLLAKPQISKSLSSFIDQYEPQNAVILNNNILDSIKANETNVHFLPHWLI